MSHRTHPYARPENIPGHGPDNRGRDDRREERPPGTFPGQDYNDRGPPRERFDDREDRHQSERGPMRREGRGRDRDKERPSRTLFIRNISFDVTADTIRQMFEPFGEMQRFFPIIESRGMAFVTYFDVRSAEQAKTTLSGAEFGGRPINIHYAVPRDEDHGGRDDTKNSGTLFCTFQDMPAPPTIEDARRYFQQFGELRAVRNCKDNQLEKFVEFNDLRDCEKAFERSQRVNFNGGLMQCRYAFELSNKDQQRRGSDERRDDRREMGRRDFPPQEGRPRREDEYRDPRDFAPRHEYDRGRDEYYRDQRMERGEFRGHERGPERGEFRGPEKSEYRGERGEFRGERGPDRGEYRGDGRDYRDRRDREFEPRDYPRDQRDPYYRRDERGRDVSPSGVAPTGALNVNNLAGANALLNSIQGRSPSNPQQAPGQAPNTAQTQALLSLLYGMNPALNPASPTSAAPATSANLADQLAQLQNAVASNPKLNQTSPPQQNRPLPSQYPDARK